MASVLDGMPALQNVNVQPALSNFAGIQDQQARLSQTAQQMDLQKRAAQEARSEKAMTYIANVAHGDPANYSAGIKAVADQFPDLAPQLMGLADPSKQGAVKDRTTSYAERIAAQNATRAQANSDRSFNLDKRKTDIAESNSTFDRTAKPSIQKITNSDGSESLVRVMPDGTTTPVYGGGGNATNPYNTGKFTDAQGKAGTYADRMATADGILGDPKIAGINEGKSGQVGGVLEKVMPGAAFNMVASSDRQRFIQAKKNFINASLRRESGAVISPSEFADADAQYFPQPNDGPDVLAQKAENRRMQITGFMREAGPSYKPPKGYEGPGTNPPSPKGSVGSQSGGLIDGPVGVGGVTPANAAPAGGPVKLGPNGEGYGAVKVGGQYMAPDGSIRTRSR